MLVCLIGKSGSGKTSIRRELVIHHDFHPVITYTTRPPRASEENHVDYHFVSEEEFKSLSNSGELLESSKYGNYFYGTPDEDYQGKHILIVDLAGFIAIKQAKRDGVLGIYLDVSKAERVARLTRDGNTKANILERLARDDGKFDKVYSWVDFVMLSHNGISENAKAINKMYNDVVNKRI